MSENKQSGPENWDINITKAQNGFVVWYDDKQFIFKNSSQLIKFIRDIANGIGYGLE